MPLKYMPHERLSLKGHPEYNERWLLERIKEDPGIFGLGEVEVRDIERRQEKAGRLDLLLEDYDAARRFEVELMLGPTDESHIMRCIEYWDIERRRYPAYEHIAVLIAEDVTTRFLNLLALFAGTIPLVVIQVNALKIEDRILLHFARILDQRELRRDDSGDSVGVVTDRAYWMARVGSEIMTAVDDMMSAISKHSGGKFVLNYTKNYIGLKDGAHSRNFVHWIPKKKMIHTKVLLADLTTAKESCNKAGLDIWDAGDKLGITVDPNEAKVNAVLIKDLLSQAVDEYNKS